MRRTIRPVAAALALCLAAGTLLAPSGGTAFAQSAAMSVTKGPSGLPLPRFVSLKARRVNLRVGPGRDYAVAWLYVKSGLPMEIIQEYDNWRRVRDAEGTEGWIYQSLLSGERAAMVAPWRRGRSAEGTDPAETHVGLFAEPARSAGLVARLEPGVVVGIDSCTGEWCEARVDGLSGWVPQAQIWGAYPGEAFK